MRTKNKKYKARKEEVVFSLGAIPKQGVPEIKIRYNKSRKAFLGTVMHSKDSADFIRRIYTRGSIELQEHFIVLYLNNRNEILGYYKHSVGSINSTIADMRIVLATALSSASTGMIIAHNHPSGNINPSESDKKLTKKFKAGAEILDIMLLDHIIITKTAYTSFAEENLL
jgi:DNA repair protein RadC